MTLLTCLAIGLIAALVITDFDWDEMFREIDDA